MSEHPDGPLRLEHLAEIESPDVMRAALKRFRRRTVVRTVAVGLLLLALPTYFRGLNQRPPAWEERVARAERVQIGTVIERDGITIAVLDARRLRAEDRIRSEDEGWGTGVPPLVEANRVLHIVVMARDVREGERLGVFAPAGPMEGEPRRTIRAIELFLPFVVDQARIEFPLYAIAEDRNVARGPGFHSWEECEVMNELDVCLLLKGEGRLLGEVTLDLDELGVPAAIRGPY